MVPFPRLQAMLLPGPRTHAQARGLAGLWPSLAIELRAVEATAADVLVDAGRLGTVGFAEPLPMASTIARRSDSLGGGQRIERHLDELGR